MRRRAWGARKRRTEAARRLPKSRLAAPHRQCACASRGTRQCGAVASPQNPRARHASSQKGLWGCGAAVSGAVAGAALRGAH